MRSNSRQNYESIAANLPDKSHLEQGQTIRGDNTLPLNGRLLKDGQRYTVQYKFWGFAAAASFTAHIAV
jgi:hypothetical protein